MSSEAEMVEAAMSFLSDGAKRALLKHRRDDGALFESVLGADDAEELWFCSMQHLLARGERIVARTRQDSGCYGFVWLYQPTPLGYAIRAALAAALEEQKP